MYPPKYPEIAKGDVDKGIVSYGIIRDTSIFGLQLRRIGGILKYVFDCQIMSRLVYKITFLGSLHD